MTTDKTKVTLTVPIKTVSEANCSEHWTKKSKRHRTQQFFVKLAFAKNDIPIKLPCRITMTRIGSRSLDQGDNLPMSFKWITDQVADCLIPGLAKGRTDGDDRIEWCYKQEKGITPAVRVEIEFEG